MFDKLQLLYCLQSFKFENKSRKNKFTHEIAKFNGSEIRENFYGNASWILDAARTVRRHVLRLKSLESARGLNKLIDNEFINEVDAELSSDDAARWRLMLSMLLLLLLATNRQRWRMKSLADADV